MTAVVGTERFPLPVLALISRECYQRYFIMTYTIPLQVEAEHHGYCDEGEVEGLPGFPCDDLEQDRGVVFRDRLAGQVQVEGDVFSGEEIVQDRTRPIHVQLPEAEEDGPVEGGIHFEDADRIRGAQAQGLDGKAGLFEPRFKRREPVDGSLCGVFAEKANGTDNFPARHGHFLRYQGE